MKVLLPTVLFCVTTIVACNDSGSTIAAQGLSCDKRVAYAGESFCLPIVNGWKEGLLDPLLSNRRGMFVDPTNITFAVYLADESWSLGKGLETAILNDYFKVYATQAGEKFKVSEEQLSQLNQEFNGSALRSQWNEVETYLNGKYADAMVGQPVLMESYQPKRGIESNVYLMRGEVEGKEMYTLVTISLCAIKERLLFVAHYLEYNGPTSVMSAKSKSDYFTLRLLAENGR